MNLLASGLTLKIEYKAMKTYLYNLIDKYWEKYEINKYYNEVVEYSKFIYEYEDKHGIWNHDHYLNLVENYNRANYAKRLHQNEDDEDDEKLNKHLEHLMMLIENFDITHPIKYNF